jgi:hypothetical protein
MSDRYADTLKDFLKSKSNVDLLVSFSVRKLKKYIPNVSEERLKACIAIHLDSLLDDFSDQYKHWKPTTDNIASINMDIFNRLKVLVESEEKHMIPDRTQFQDFRVVESKDMSHDEAEPSEQENFLVQEQYKKLWDLK